MSEMILLDRNMIPFIKHCVGQDKKSYTYACVLFQSLEDDNGSPIIRMVGTNGHRLGLVDIPNENGFDIPKNTCVWWGSFPTPADLKKYNDINMTFTNGKVEFHLDDKEIIESEIIDREFPDYTELVPPRSDKKAVVNRKLLLKQFPTRKKERNCQSILTFTNDDVLFCEYHHLYKDEGGDFTIPSSNSELHGFKICIDMQYLFDYLKSVQSENITMYFTDQLEPIRMESGCGEIYILMPIKI